MNTRAREQIFANLRKNLKRGALQGEPLTVLETRLAQPQRHLIPARAQLAHHDQVTLFIEMAEFASASVQRVTSASEVPAAVAEFILRSNLPSDIVLAPDDELNALPWQAQERLRTERRNVQNGDRITVTPAFAGIAETGTLMLLSGPHSPTRMNFLADVHIAVLSADNIVGPYEEAWDRLREQTAIPRTVNLITGPSRSADIEQTLQLGAHGPIQLHIILVQPQT